MYQGFMGCVTDVTDKMNFFIFFIKKIKISIYIRKIGGKCVTFYI